MVITISQLAQTTSVLTVALKVAEQISDFWKRVGRERKSRWLREEISSLQEFQKAAPSELRDLVDSQLKALCQDYLTLWRPKPEPSLIYPKLPRWRKVVLLYIPARKRALIPQVLFYFYAAISPGIFVTRLSRQQKLSDLFLTAMLVIFLRDWAVRAERPRQKRKLLENILLAYPQPELAPGYTGKLSRQSRRTFTVMYYICGLWSVLSLTVPPHFLPGLWKTMPRPDLLFLASLTAALAVAFHDYVRSFDVELLAAEGHEDSSAAQAAG